MLANNRSDVLTDHCQRSNAGLYYADRDEFVESLKLLMSNPDLRAAMGRNGRAYVQSNYSWNVILDKYERMIGTVSGGPASSTPVARITQSGPRRTVPTPPDAIEGLISRLRQAHLTRVRRFSIRSAISDETGLDCASGLRSSFAVGIRGVSAEAVEVSRRRRGRIPYRLIISLRGGRLDLE